MITHISISNYALIQKLELEVSKGFSTFTGETGAGKSILLGAIGLCLGKRADSTVVRNESKKCVVELTVKIENLGLEEFFEKNDLDLISETIIRREVSAQGRSRSFINDTPVKLDVLHKLGGQLIDVHSQHDTLLINNSEYQLQLVDVLAGNEKQKANYIKSYNSFKSLELEQKIFLDSLDSNIDVDYMTFLLKELEEAVIEPGQLQKLEKDIEVLENAEDIQRALGEVDTLLNESSVGALELLSQAKQKLSGITSLSEAYQDLYDRLDSCRIELDDVKSELIVQADAVESNPDILFKAQDRYNQIQTLLQKHRVEDELELLKFSEELSDKLSAFKNREGAIRDWETRVQQAENIAIEKGELLSKSRKSIIPSVCKEINEICKSLNFAYPDFKIVLSKTNKLMKAGIDELEFKFSANKGHEPKPIAKAASGGELSRVMLALKSILAKTHGLPTIIFDEIDTGVSGETAVRVAEILKQMGNSMQVWAITHLPQIASSGSSHYVVSKQDVNGITQTDIGLLKEEERVNAIAVMLSSASPTKAAIENARELLSVS